MAERLESLVGAQQLLLRDVSHELRSPLARLSVALELAREDASPEMATQLNRMERESEKLNQLIGQLLTLSSMEAIESADRFVPVSLNQIVAQMIPDAQYEASQRQCSVVFRSENDCTVQGNRHLLYRAIENVLRNAIQYTNPGTEVEIRVAAGQDEAGRSVSWWKSAIAGREFLKRKSTPSFARSIAWTARGARRQGDSEWDWPSPSAR